MGLLCWWLGRFLRQLPNWARAYQYGSIYIDCFSDMPFKPARKGGLPCKLGKIKTTASVNTEVRFPCLQILTWKERLPRKKGVILRETDRTAITEVIHQGCSNFRSKPRTGAAEHVPCLSIYLWIYQPFYFLDKRSWNGCLTFGEDEKVGKTGGAGLVWLWVSDGCVCKSLGLLCLNINEWTGMSMGCFGLWWPVVNWNPKSRKNISAMAFFGNVWCWTDKARASLKPLDCMPVNKTVWPGGAKRRTHSVTFAQSCPPLHEGRPSLLQTAIQGHEDISSQQGRLIQKSNRNTNWAAWQVRRENVLTQVGLDVHHLWTEGPCSFWGRPEGNWLTGGQGSHRGAHISGGSGHNFKEPSKVPLDWNF